MHKALLFLATLLCIAQTAVVALDPSFAIYNNDDSLRTGFSCRPNERVCICLKKTQTNRIITMGAGDVKLFTTTDCTGNYGTMPSSGEIKNAQWVNSISWGKSGIASKKRGTCQNWYM